MFPAYKTPVRVIDFSKNQKFWRRYASKEKSSTMTNVRPAKNGGSSFSWICRCTCHHVLLEHSGWKSQKKSHSTLRAKRAAFTFWLVKIGGKCQNWKIEMRLSGWFSNTVRNRQQMNLTGDQIKLSSASNVVFSISYQQNTTRNLRAR